MLDRELLRPERVRGLRRVEYDRLVELGMFEDERLELLRGELVAMSPQNGVHASITAWLAQRLILALDLSRYDVRSHSPFAASDDSVPEPDVSVSPRRGGRDHPRVALLLVEVAASSLRKDRRIKTAIYAEAGVPEYWIVDVRRRTVEVLTGPTARGYRSRQQLGPKDVLAPLAFPAFRLRVSELWRSPAVPGKRRR